MTRQDSPSPRESFVEVNPHAAGLDIGSAEIWACVPADRDAQPVRAFGTFPPRFDRPRRLATSVWRRDGSHGIHGRVLDSGL